jgi:O-antigen/teichoic acid export membrane protein
VAKNSLIYLLGQCLTWSVTLVALTIIPRRLGETAMGQIAFAGTVVGTVFQFLCLSIESFLTTEVGRDRREAERLIQAVLGLRLVLIPVLAAAVCAILAATHASPVVWKLALVVLVGVTIAFVLGPLNYVLVGLEEARRVMAINTLNSSSQLFAVPFLRYGPISVVAASVSVQALTAAMQVAWIRTRVRLRPVFRRAEWEHVVRGGLPFLANTLAMSLYGFTTVFLLRHFSGEAAVGVYSQSQRIFGTFLFIPTAIGSALLPSLSRLVAAAPSEFRAMQSRILSLMVTLGLPVACGAFLLAKPLCNLLYGHHGFGGVPAALQVAAFNVIPVYITSTMYQFLTAQRKNAVWSLFLMATVALNALGCVALIPLCERVFNNAAMGAQAACLIAELVTVPFALVLLRTNPFDGVTLSRLTRAFAAAAAMAAVMWATRGLFIVVPAALGLVTFAAAAWSLHALGDEDQARLVELVRARLRRR